MTFPFASKNGALIPYAEAAVPVTNIAYAYGFGVYESLRVTDNVVFFLDQHINRLITSAEMIGLAHPFSPETISQSLRTLVTKTLGTYNVKILLIGAARPEDVLLFMLPSAPLFPDRKLYRDGATAITVHGRRPFPKAKTLNMLTSHLAYTKAREVGCYDALLVNEKDEIIEGTRCNFFAIRGRTIVSPPNAEILDGVTRDIVLALARQHNFAVEEHPINKDTLSEYDGAFLTSTSGKVLPLRTIDDFSFPGIPTTIHELVKIYDDFLKNYHNP
ncbi:MAG: aminotransferase class IV family protein [Candidatus Kerfeldbacteria bacterium]|nr:aminotransferase class IV family protein [Candidatus Kerfeldbacteria bacterium]